MSLMTNTGMNSSIKGRRAAKNGSCQQFVEEQHQINNIRGSQCSFIPDADNNPQPKALTPSPTNALNKTVSIIASFSFPWNRPRNAEQSPESAKTLEIDVRLAKKSSKQNYQIPSSIDCCNPVFSSASFGSRPRHLTGDRGRASLSTPREPSAEGDRGRIDRRNRHWDELREALAFGVQLWQGTGAGESSDYGNDIAFRSTVQYDNWSKLGWIPARYDNWWRGKADTQSFNSKFITE